MKKIVTLLILAGMFSASVFGQDKKKTEPLPGFSMGIEPAFPTGDLKLISSMGMGIKMQTFTPFCSMAGVSLSAGVTDYFLANDVKTNEEKSLFAFPVEAGCRLFLPKGVYFEPKTGFTYFSDKGGNNIAFTYALNVGVMTSNFVDVSFCYENAPYKGLTLSHTGITIAYIFH